MDVNDKRGRLFGVGLEEVQYLALVVAITDVGKRRWHAIAWRCFRLLLGFRLFLDTLCLRRMWGAQEDHAGKPGHKTGCMVWAGARRDCGHARILLRVGGQFDLVMGELNCAETQVTPLFERSILTPQSVSIGSFRPQQDCDDTRGDGCQDRHAGPQVVDCAGPQLQDLLQALAVCLPPGQIRPIQVRRRYGIGSLDKVGTECREDRECRDVDEGQ